MEQDPLGGEFFRELKVRIGKQIHEALHVEKDKPPELRKLVVFADESDEEKGFQ